MENNYEFPEDDTKTYPQCLAFKAETYLKPCQTPLTNASTKFINGCNLKKGKEQNVNIESRDKFRALHVYFHKTYKYQTWKSSDLG